MVAFWPFPSSESACENLGKTKEHRKNNGDGVNICPKNNDVCNYETSWCYMVFCSYQKPLV